MHIAGLPGEVAGKLYLNPVIWNAFRSYGSIHNLADLEDWIDVKTRTKSWHDLIVQEDDPPGWAYLLVYSNRHPVYQIVGWCWGWEAQQKKFWDDPAGGRAAYFVKRAETIMKPPEELFAIVRQRQTMTKASNQLHA